MTAAPEPDVPLDDGELRREVAGRQWYHTIELAPGVVTPGWFDTRELAALLPIPDRLDRLRCLDIGTFDGFWAFELERRGASDVVTIDVLDQSRWDWPAASPEAVREEIADRHRGGGGFDIARRALGSGVTRRDLSIYDLAPGDIGTFDFVYLGSLLLHLRDPIGALERVREVTRGHLLVVDAVDRGLSLLHPRRAVADLDGRDRPWWWTPNRAALEAMVRAAGFVLEQPSRYVRMPPGVGQTRTPLRPRVLRSRVGRQALVRSRWGEPHLALLARPH